jgi:hypothetical protein
MGLIALTLISWIWFACLNSTFNTLKLIVTPLLIACVLTPLAIWALVWIIINGKWAYISATILSLLVASEIILLPNPKIFGAYFVVGFLSALWIFLTFVGIYWTYAVSRDKNFSAMLEVFSGSKTMIYDITTEESNYVLKREIVATSMATNTKMVKDLQDTSILAAVQDGIFWILLLGNRVWKYFAIALGYVALMMLPVFSSALNIVTLGIFVPNAIIHSLVIAFELAFLPAIVLEIKHEMNKYEAYKDYLKEETGRKLVTALGRTKMYKQN